MSWKHILLTYEHGEFDPQTQRWIKDSGYVSAKCAFCEEEKVFAKQIHSSYEARKQFSDAHNNCPKTAKCPDCEELMTRKALKRHRTGLYCSSQRKRNELIKQNKSELSWWLANDLEGQIQNKVEMLVYGTMLRRVRRSYQKDDSLNISSLSHREIASIKNVANDTLAYIKDIIQYEEHFTRYCRPGWGGKARVEKSAWISTEYNYLFSFFRTWDDDAIQHIIRYHENPHEREAIICFLEMRKEAEG